MQEKILRDKENEKYNTHNKYCYNVDIERKY